MGKIKLQPLLEAFNSILHYHGSIHDDYLRRSIIMGEETLDLKIHEEMEKKAYKKGEEDLKKSILDLLKNDSLAITYQSMRQYREALIAVIKTL